MASLSQTQRKILGTISSLKRTDTPLVSLSSHNSASPSPSLTDISRELFPECGNDPPMTSRGASSSGLGAGLAMPVELIGGAGAARAEKVDKGRFVWIPSSLMESRGDGGDGIIDEDEDVFLARKGLKRVTSAEKDKVRRELSAEIEFFYDPYGDEPLPDSPPLSMHSNSRTPSPGVTTPSTDENSKPLCPRTGPRLPPFRLAGDPDLPINHNSKTNSPQNSRSNSPSQYPSSSSTTLGNRSPPRIYSLLSNSSLITPKSTPRKGVTFADDVSLVGEVSTSSGEAAAGSKVKAELVARARSGSGDLGLNFGAVSLNSPSPTAPTFPPSLLIGGQIFRCVTPDGAVNTNEIIRLGDEDLEEEMDLEEERVTKRRKSNRGVRLFE